MNYRDMTTALLLLALAAMIAAIFASLIPGAWWQWLATFVVLLFTAAACSNAADEESR